MSVVKILALLLSLLLHLVAVTRVQKPVPLRLLTLLPYPSDDPAQQPQWAGGPDFIPATHLTVDLINNSSQVLPDYHLELLDEDGGCDLKYIKSRCQFRPIRRVLEKISPGCWPDWRVMFHILASDRSSAYNGQRSAFSGKHTAGGLPTFQRRPD